MLELASAAYEEQHDTEKAVDALRQAILLDPKNVKLYVDFAAISATHQSIPGWNQCRKRWDQPAAQCGAAIFCARSALCAASRIRKGPGRLRKSLRLDPNQSLSVAAAQGLAAVQQNDLTGR